MSRYVTCPDCDGSGWVDRDGEPTTRSVDPDAHRCDTCGGRGEYLEGSDE